MITRETIDRLCLSAEDVLEENDCADIHIGVGRSKFDGLMACGAKLTTYLYADRPSPSAIDVAIFERDRVRIKAQCDRSELTSSELLEVAEFIAERVAKEAA